jgi:hypothetical protein
LRQVKRLMILLVLAGFVWPLAACEAPNIPPLPQEEDPDEDPDDDNDPDDVGFLHFLDGPAILA